MQVHAKVDQLKTQRAPAAALAALGVVVLSVFLAVAGFVSSASAVVWVLAA